MDGARWRLVRPLLDEALGLSGDGRARWLGELAARDRELHADVVRLLARGEGEDTLERAATAVGRIARHARAP